MDVGRVHSFEASCVVPEDNLIRLGASVAYYTLFAIAPILLIAVAVAGAAFGDEAVRVGG